MEKIHITLKEGQKIFFTSDLHIGHRNVIRFSNRPFADVKEMNQAILDNINNAVAENDYLFMLGDIFWFNDSHAIKRFFNQVVCKNIYIIPGNHDDFKGYHRLEEGYVKICRDITCLFLDKEYDKTIYELWLSHFPMMTWPHRENKRCYQLFGHIHSGERRDKSMMDQDLPLHSNQFDVGVDNWNYKPVEINEFLKIDKK
jgi:calcineurin-like phosphoesterase family protein